MPAPIVTLAVPRRTAPGLPFGSRPSCSTTASVPTGAYLPPIRGTSSSRGLASPSRPGGDPPDSAAAAALAAAIEARTSGSDASSGTTIVGSTTSSSSGSTGSVRVLFSLIKPSSSG